MFSSGCLSLLRRSVYTSLTFGTRSAVFRAMASGGRLRPEEKENRTRRTRWSPVMPPAESSNPAINWSAQQIEGFTLEVKQGDLFECPVTDSLAHCISEDCRMGKGIAVIFRKKFGGVEDLKRQGKRTGDVAVLKRRERYVYYLITKEKYWHKPTYESLESSLQKMLEHCIKHNVTDIAMPKIGCGLDKLEWEHVTGVIASVFKDSNINITVYEL